MGKILEEKALKLKDATLALYNTLGEGNDIFKGVDECIDDAVQAVMQNDLKKDKRVVALEIDESGENYKIFDNGFGQTPEELKLAYSNCYHSGWKRNDYVGIRGFGRFVFLAIVANFKNKNCHAKIVSSIGDEYATEISLNLTPDDESLSSPIYKVVENDFDNNAYNISNRKLRGTIVEVYNGEKILFDEKQKVYLGARHKTAIFDKAVGIFINGEQIEGIDITHDRNVIVKDRIVCQGINSKKSDKYATLFKELKVFNKNSKDTIFPVDVKCTVSLNVSLTNKYCPWEKYFRFNELGGVFVDFNGRLVEIGGNTQSHFKQAVKKGDTKTVSCYGDTVGGTTGHLRLTIFPKDKEMANILGIGSVKSNGIIPLADNEKLIEDYFVIDEKTGRVVSFYKAVSHIRHFFSKVVYRKYIMPQLKTAEAKNKDSINYEKADAKINEYYKDYDFIDGKLLTIKQQGRKKGKATKKDKIVISNKSILVKFSLIKNKENDTPTYVIEKDKVEVNKKSFFYKDRYYFLSKTQRENIFNNFYEISKALVMADSTEWEINSVLTKYTEIQASKF